MDLSRLALAIQVFSSGEQTGRIIFAKTARTIVYSTRPTFPYPVLALPCKRERTGQPFAAIMIGRVRVQAGRVW